MFSKMRKARDSSRADASTNDDNEDDSTDCSTQPVRSDMQEIWANIEDALQHIKEEHQRMRNAIHVDFRQNVLGHITASASATKGMTDDTASPCAKGMTDDTASPCAKDMTDDTASPCAKSAHGSKSGIDVVSEEFLQSLTAQKSALLKSKDEPSTCTASSSSSSSSRLLSRPRLNEPEEEISKDNDDSSHHITELKKVMTAHTSLSRRRLLIYNQAKLSPRYKQLRALHQQQKLGGVLSNDCILPAISTKTSDVTEDKGQQKSSTASLETDLSSRESLRSQNWSYYGLYMPEAPSADSMPSRYKSNGGPHKGKYTKPKK